MSEPRPLVSVVMASYNYGALLGEALETALAQTYQPVEIIVVDDGSTDDSRTVLERYPVRAIHQANAGQAVALNVGVACAAGDILCLLDADDGWAPNKVERVVDTFRQHRDAQWIRHELEIVDAGRRPTGQVTPAIAASGPVAPDAAGIGERVLTASTSALSLRREAAAQVFPLAGGSRLRFDADALLLARLGSRYPGWQLDETLGFYRRHEGQQYAKEEDLKRMLERQIEVGTMIAAALGRSEPVSNHKHRAVLAGLTGGLRGPHVARGLLASLGLLGRPALMARQTAGLLYAAAAPAWWLRSVRRRQGLP